MPGPDSVGANEKWLIVIEVRGTLDSEAASKFNRAIHDAVKTQNKAKVTFSNTGPATA